MSKPRQNRINLANALQKVQEFITSLENIEEFSGTIKPELFFSIQDEGTLYLSGEDVLHYKECLRLLLNTIGDEIISLKAIEKLFQKAILSTLDINEKRRDISFAQRLEIGLKEMREVLLDTPKTIQVYYPIHGLKDEGLPVKVGKITFCIFDENHLANFIKVLEENNGDAARNEAKQSFIEDIKSSEVVGKTTGLVELKAMDYDAAKSLAVKELSITLDIINFYSDLIPYQKGHLFLPGERERKNINIPTITVGDTPYITYGWEVVGPLMQLSISSLFEIDKSKKLGFLRASELLATKTKSNLDEILLSALQWAGRATVETTKEQAFLLYAISLESLILSDNEPIELSYRLKTRIAHLLGENLEERIEISKKVGDLYKIRSKIVHNGWYQLTDAEVGMMRFIAKGCILRILSDEPFKLMKSINELADWFNKAVPRK